MRRLRFDGGLRAASGPPTRFNEDNYATTRGDGRGRGEGRLGDSRTRDREREREGVMQLLN